MKQHVLFLLISISMMYIMLVSAECETFAENIDPNDDGSQYAYGENVGWFNAEPLGNGGPGVKVENTKLTGYIWAENIGWISLSCLNTGNCGTVDYGVTNDGDGNLSGYAWGENVGWISFSCENTGSCATVNYNVTIDPITGEFNGQAWGENIGWITLRSTNPISFGITTFWQASVNDCDGDFDSDGDVDGSDLAKLVANPSQLSLSSFAEEFGVTTCSN
ncbi:MAG: hypothetical protein SVW57_00210 [Thermodesulfobacteriota bacterium]|nr:hypothetical protein [Thermodesulfobacteriota bacterium]